MDGPSAPSGSPTSSASVFSFSIPVLNYEYLLDWTRFLICGILTWRKENRARGGEE